MGKKEDIIIRAFDVFYAHGFHMSGVAPLLAETGISKRTLYKYFRSKEDLIVAVIEYYQHKCFTEIPAELDRRAKTPKDKILAIFDIKAEPVMQGDFRGCLALRAKLEFESAHPDIEGACKTFNQELEKFVAELCTQAKCKTAEYVAKQIMILLEGAIVLGQIHGEASVFVAAKDAAEKLLLTNI